MNYRHLKIFFHSFLFLCFPFPLLTSLAHDHQAQIEKKAEQRIILKPEVKNQLLKVFQAMEDLHMAFFKYQADKVETLSREILTYSKKIDDPDISKILKPYLKNIENILSKNERKNNDHHFEFFNKGLLVVLRKYDLGRDYQEYYCPMLKKSWIQNSLKLLKVHNPYAPKMKHCGEAKPAY